MFSLLGPGKGDDQTANVDRALNTLRRSMRALLPLEVLQPLITQTEERLQRFPSIKSRKPTARMGINARLPQLLLHPQSPWLTVHILQRKMLLSWKCRRCDWNPESCRCLYFLPPSTSDSLLPGTVCAQAGK